MNRQQKNNLLCILTIIFAGLILIGNERTMRQDNVKFKSITQWEKEEKLFFDSLDKVSIIIPADTNLKLGNTFSYSIAFATAESDLNDILYDPAEARRREHDEKVFIALTISAVVLLIIRCIFLPSLLTWYEGRKRIPGLIITKDEYDEFKHHRDSIGEKLSEIKSKIELYQQDKDNAMKAAYCLSIADGMEQVKKKLDEESDKIEKWMSMTQEERLKVIMEQMANGMAIMKELAKKISEETVEQNLKDSGI